MILTLEEMLRITRVGIQLGISKVRITGGEPLVRAGVVDFIASISRLSGIKDLGLTTNGTLLSRHVDSLYNAGLRRVNVGLPSLRPGRYPRLTRGGKLEEAVRGLTSALDRGFTVKVNVVLMRGINDDEVLDYVRLAKEMPVEVRFIEFMPLCGAAWQVESFVPLAEIRNGIERVVDLRPLDSNEGVARRFAVDDGVGVVGFISPLTEPFCSACNRIRLSARGVLTLCLLKSVGVDLLPLIRSGASDLELEGAFSRAVSLKPKAHGIELATCQPQQVFIRSIGG